MSVRGASLTVVLTAALALAGCGTDEKSGTVGDTFAVDHLSVTLQKVDTSVPVPEKDVTGLSLPAPGSKLFGARVRVCTDEVGAIVPVAFGLDLQDGGHGTLKFPAQNYPNAYESVRDGCGDGWLVFNLPAGATADRLTFRFENSGSSNRYGNGQDDVDVRFTWSVDA